MLLKQNVYVVFCLGIICGVTFTFLYNKLALPSQYVAGFGHVSINQPRSHGHDVAAGQLVAAKVNLDHSHMEEDRAVATDLSKKVRILCWILTSPKDHRTKADHVKATWGKRCNILLFMSSEDDVTLPTVNLVKTAGIREGYDYLWGKTKAAFKYSWDHYKNEADWFMKADDDTYVVVENLRYMLSKYDTSNPLYFGRRFKPFVKQGYMSGGAGYVLSKAALQKFVEEALHTPGSCNVKQDTGPEDAAMGTCLQNVGVFAGDSRDEQERERFMPFTPQSHLTDKYNPGFWYYSYNFYPTRMGVDCCSDLAITFHYVNPKDMYALEYFVYHLRPYGIKRDDEKVVLTTNTIPTEELARVAKGPGKRKRAVHQLLKTKDSQPAR